jgi:hypothetical protein
MALAPLISGVCKRGTWPITSIQKNHQNYDVNRLLMLKSSEKNFPSSGFIFKQVPFRLYNS